MLKILITAVAKNNVIGRSTGEMPWHSKEETQHFKQTTLGFPVIMGRKTIEALGKPLEGRINMSAAGWVYTNNIIPTELSITNDNGETQTTESDIDFLIILGEKTANLVLR